MKLPGHRGHCTYRMKWQGSSISLADIRYFRKDLSTVIDRFSAGFCKGVNIRQTDRSKSRRQVANASRRPWRMSKAAGESESRLAGGIRVAWILTLREVVTARRSTSSRLRSARTARRTHPTTIALPSVSRTTTPPVIPQRVESLSHLDSETMRARSTPPSGAARERECCALAAQSCRQPTRATLGCPANTTRGALGGSDSVDVRPPRASFEETHEMEPGLRINRRRCVSSRGSSLRQGT